MDDESELKLRALLAAFCGEDEDRAASAFQKLAELTRRGLNGYLRNKLLSEEARVDVIEEVIRRVWSRRSRFVNHGIAGWWSFVKRAADQCRLDLVRKIGPEIGWDDSEAGDIPSHEHETMVALLESTVSRREFYRLADELWLGFSPKLSERARARRVLAADLYYRQGLSWEAVTGILHRSNPGENFTRTELDAWLSKPSTIRALAFQALYLNNDGLTRHLLGLDDDQADSLNAVSRLAMSGQEDVIPPANWTWPQVRAIIWRFRHADRNDQILARELCSMHKQELLELFDRCQSLFPFLEIMNQLCTNLDKWPKARIELTDINLWQRLVLEYYAKDTSHHRDILDRTATPAALAPYQINRGVLNVWLSNGRLIGKLAAYAEKRRQSK